jgi:hypothetical protein
VSSELSPLEAAAASEFKDILVAQLKTYHSTETLVARRAYATGHTLTAIGKQLRDGEPISKVAISKRLTHLSTFILPVVHRYVAEGGHPSQIEPMLNEALEIVLGEHGRAALERIANGIGGQQR